MVRKSRPLVESVGVQKESLHLLESVGVQKEFPIYLLVRDVIIGLIPVIFPLVETIVLWTMWAQSP